MKRQVSPLLLALLFCLATVPSAMCGEERTEVTPTPFGMLMQSLFDSHLRVVIDFGEELQTDLTGSTLDFETPTGKKSLRLMPGGALAFVGSETVWPKDLALHSFWYLASGTLRIEVPWSRMGLPGTDFVALVFVPSQALEF